MAENNQIGQSRRDFLIGAGGAVAATALRASPAGAAPDSSSRRDSNPSESSDLAADLRTARDATPAPARFPVSVRFLGKLRSSP